MPGAKGVQTTVKAIKVPFFRTISNVIRKYFPSLNRGKGIRIGPSTSKGREVFRGTRGGRKNHWWDIDLGPIPKTKK